MRLPVHAFPGLSFAFLILSRLVPGVGESLGSTGSTLWGISSAGQAKHRQNHLLQRHQHLMAPWRWALRWAWLLIRCGETRQWGLASIGLLTCSLAPSALALAYRKSPSL